MRRTIEIWDCDRCAADLTLDNTGNDERGKWALISVQQRSGLGVQLGVKDDKHLCAACLAEFSLWWDRKRSSASSIR